MKIEFRREEHGGIKVVKLYVGGEFVCQIGEMSVTVTDWKNASEAEHECREELKKWLGEKPPKPMQVKDWREGELCVFDSAVTPAFEDSVIYMIAMVEQRTRSIVAWEQEHGDE